MAFPLLGNPKPTFLDSSGSPLVGGLLYVYEPTDDTNKATYPTADDADAATNANTNPIVLDSRGEPPNGLFGIDDESYKLTLTDSDGTTIWSADDIQVPGLVPTLTYNQGSTGAVDRTLEARLQDFVSVKDFGAVGDGAADDTTAIQAAIDAIEGNNGGIVYFPVGNYLISNTLTVNTRGVRLIGEAGGADNHDAVGQTYSTQFTWGGSAGGTMVRIYPTSAQRLAGNEVSGFRFDGGTNIAAKGLVVESIHKARITDLHFHGFSGNCLEFNVTSGLSEGNDFQFSFVDRISFRQSGADNASYNGTCLFLGGEVGGGNVSLTTFSNIDAIHDDGIGIDCDNCDNCLFTNIRTFRQAGGTGDAIKFRAGATSDDRARGNTFIRLSNNAAITAEGTPTATNASINNIIYLHDDENSAVSPTVETGATCFVNNNQAVFEAEWGFVQPVFGQSVENALTERGNFTNETLRIANGSSNHVRLTNGTDEWEVSIDELDGNLRIVRQAGSGAFNIPLNTAVGLTRYAASSDGTTGGTGSSGAGNQYVELYINGTTYKVLHDGTV